MIKPRALRIGHRVAVVAPASPPDRDAFGRDVDAVVTGLARDFPGPVLFGLPSGRSAGPVLAVPPGARVRVRAGRHPGVVVEEAGVE
jgi:hypothetical protein